MTSIFDDFGPHFTSQDGLPKSDSTDLFAQERPRAARERPKSAPRAPKSAPRAPKMAPRVPQERPRWLQERPKRPKRATKIFFSQGTWARKVFLGLLVVFWIVNLAGASQDPRDRPRSPSKFEQPGLGGFSKAERKGRGKIIPAHRTP